jgi:hypothetical protein
MLTYYNTEFIITELLLIILYNNLCEKIGKILSFLILLSIKLIMIIKIYESITKLTKG